MLDDGVCRPGMLVSNLIWIHGKPTYESSDYPPAYVPTRSCRASKPPFR